MKKTLACLLGLAAAGIALQADAHGITRPQHGGVVQMNGETLFELVAAPTGVSLFVVDEDEPVQASSMSAMLSVAAGGKKTQVAMTPAGGNRFFAKGLKLPKGATAGVLVIDKGTKARYGTSFVIR